MRGRRGGGGREGESQRYERGEKSPASTRMERTFGQSVDKAVAITGVRKI